MARYIPALRFDAMTRFYDPIVAATTRERRFKSMLVEQVGLQPGQRLLDVGCGTATLTLMLKRACPRAEVVGLDADPVALGIAHRKAARAGLAIELREGMAQAPGVPDASFDHVTASLVFHHLDAAGKASALAAILRALVPGGALHIADWGRAHDPLMRLMFLGVQLLDGFATTTDHVRGRLPDYLRRAGFVEVEETRRLRTPMGTIALYRGRRPPAAQAARAHA
jgi:ubiquinone/menaquinone biosynthesis C-methylase UbiE